MSAVSLDMLVWNFKNLQIAGQICGRNESSYYITLLEELSYPVPIYCSHVSVSACQLPSSNSTSSKYANLLLLSLPEWYIYFLRNLPEGFRQIHYMTTSPPNLTVCRRLNFWIIRSYNPVRCNHLLADPVELLAGRSTAAKTLFDSDLIKSVCTCVRALVEIQPWGTTKPTLHAQPITLQNCTQQHTPQTSSCGSGLNCCTGHGCRCNSFILLVGWKMAMIITLTVL